MVLLQRLLLLDLRLTVIVASCQVAGGRSGVHLDETRNRNRFKATRKQLCLEK